VTAAIAKTCISLWISAQLHKDFSSENKVNSGVNTFLSCTIQISDYVQTYMDWQQSVSLVIVCAAAAWLLWSRFRPRKFSFQRDTHCGCSTAGNPPQYSVIYRARKGERPQVVIKPK